MRKALFAFAFTLAPCLVGCIIVDSKDSSHGGRETNLEANARLVGKNGVGLSGHATFTEMEGGVLVEIVVRNLTPGHHAVHIHENGDCSAPDASSAGGHFNPTDEPHGSPHMTKHHLGDLGNLYVQPDRTGYHSIFMPELSVRNGPRSIREKSVVIHANPDDLSSQPSGNAGPRIGCGVIR
ncbi:MAG: superoxide dismutase [Planctomycetes bacterium]|jgi:Cu-Zn family superoxide dismutase|nr:superoxide dismutase [Planctomycetota bacterium]